MCVYVNYMPNALYELLYMGEGGCNYTPLYRIRATKKGPRTRVTSNPDEARKRETRQPITKIATLQRKAPGRAPTAMKQRSQGTCARREPSTGPKAPCAQGPHLLSAGGIDDILQISRRDLILERPYTQG